MKILPLIACVLLNATAAIAAPIYYTFHQLEASRADLNITASILVDSTPLDIPAVGNQFNVPPPYDFGNLKALTVQVPQLYLTLDQFTSSVPRTAWDPTWHMGPGYIYFLGGPGRDIEVTVNFFTGTITSAIIESYSATGTWVAEAPPHNLVHNPEPGTWLLLSTGLGLAYLKRRR